MKQSGSDALAVIQAREAAHFLPVVKRLPVALVEGRGSRVRDVAGREYVDLTGGWGVVAIGHSHPALVAAIAGQAGRLMQTTNLFYTLPQLDLIEKLAAVVPAPLTRSFLVSSGAEAMEGALKLAHRATGRRHFVATHNSFHGRTLGALSVIGQPKHRDRYAPLLHEQDFVPFGDLAAMRAAVNESTAAVLVVPVQGEGGVNVAPPGYQAGLREICDAAGALLIADEIQTGIGRTGRLFAFDHAGIEPDIVTLGKGLGGGAPLAALLAAEPACCFDYGDQGGTFNGSALMTAIGSAVVETVARPEFLAAVTATGDYLADRLRQLSAALGHGEVRGRGLLLALQLRGLDASKVARNALDRGLLINAPRPDTLRFMPALNVTRSEIDQMLELLEAVLRET